MSERQWDIIPMLFGVCAEEMRFLVPPNRQALLAVPDMERLLGFHRATLSQLVIRNVDELEGDVFRARITRARKGRAEAVVSCMPCTADEPRLAVSNHQQWVLCVTRDGLLGLISLICARRIKDPLRRARVIAFKKWARKALGCLLDGTLPPELKVPLRAHMSLRRLGQKGEHVRQLAADAGVSASAIWRRIRQAKIQAALPLRGTRSDAGIPRPDRWRKKVSRRQSEEREQRLYEYQHASSPSDR